MGEQQKMTIEEAIAILDPETRRAALFGYRYFGGFRGSEAVVCPITTLALMILVPTAAAIAMPQKTMP